MYKFKRKFTTSNYPSFAPHSVAVALNYTTSGSCAGGRIDVITQYIG